MVPLSNSRRKTGRLPVYRHGLFELSVDPSYDLLDNIFNIYNFILFKKKK
jgi:hypothetical protein